jgi:hypothetical protein
VTSIDITDIPDHLKREHRWNCFRWEFRHGAWTQVLYTPTGEELTGPLVPGHSFEAATAALRTHAFDGLTCASGPPRATVWGVEGEG